MSEQGQPTVDIRPSSARKSVGVFQLIEERASARTRASAGRITLGSHASNDVVLTDPTVSRFHCELVTRDDGVWLLDLASRNGTLVDGVRVKEAMLRHGQALRLGNASLRFEMLADREAVEVSAQASFGSLVGSSQVMRALFAKLERMEHTEATVLLEGETGTGKGAIAEALHAASPRAKGPFIVVDCGALTASLLESELFGHEKGAFTGADARRIGAFEEASGGTIFLDEIGELPLEMQPRLLRVLENRTVRRVGHNTQTAVDLRVIAATNRDLRGLVNDGTFRADLYYRLAVVRLHVPALRDRLTDLPELAATLLRGFDASPAQLARLTSPEVLDRLLASAWPGNIRELRNYLERSMVFEADAQLDAPLGTSDALLTLPEARRRALDAFERRYLEDLLQRHHGKVAAAARTAGVARVYLYRLLAKYGLKPGAGADGE